MIGTPAVRNSVPVVKDLRRFAREARPVGETLADLLVSFRDNEGIERALDYIFFQAQAVNGFDSFGHYLRAGLIVNQCSSYAIRPTTGCSANFGGGSTASVAGADVDAARPGARRDDARAARARPAQAAARGARARPQPPHARRRGPRRRAP